jgi:hypothetical protein
MTPTFRLESANSTEICDELKRIKARLVDIEAEHARLLEEAERLWKRLEQLCGTPEKSSEQVMREIEANIKRSVTRIIRDRQRQGRSPETARQAAIDRAAIVADRQFLPAVPASIAQYIDAKLKAAYGRRPQGTRRSR